MNQNFLNKIFGVFLPIRTVPEFKFTGFSGLASHGAAIVLVCSTIFLAIKVLKKSFWLLDRLAITVALAGFFIRIGNFFNSEIVGKPAQFCFAVQFPQDNSYPIVPRYPTQLFRSVFLFGIIFCNVGNLFVHQEKIQSRLAFRIFLCRFVEH